MVAAVVGAGPNIVRAIVVLVVGKLLAMLARRVTSHGLRALGIDVIYRRLNKGPELQAGGVAQGASELGGFVVYWTIMISAVLYALQLLGLEEATILLQRLLAFLPEGFIAIILLTIGLYAADLLARITTVGATSARLPVPRWWGLGVQYATVGFTVVAVLEYLQVSTSGVLLLAGIPLGAVPVAAMLAFGLGGRRHAKELIGGKGLRRHLNPGDRLVAQVEGARLDGVIEELCPTFVRLRVGDAIHFVPYSALTENVATVYPAEGDVPEAAKGKGTEEVG